MSKEFDRILQEKDQALQRKMIRELRSSKEDVYLILEDWSDPRYNSLVTSCVTHLTVRNVKHCTPLGEYPYYFRNLQILHLRNNWITDLRPLSNLANLQILDLHNNLITDLRPLSNLTNLLRLDLCKNPITNYSPLDKLVQKGLKLYK